MNEEKYNGWTNRKTWMVKLWIDNEQGLYFHWRGRAKAVVTDQRSEDSVHTLARELEEWCDEEAPTLKGMFADLLHAAICRVDWVEIAKAMLDDLEEADADKLFSRGDLIFCYSRAQAIADGVLIDVTKLAKEAGFRYPVAMTSAAWETCVRVPEGAVDQDETGRLWDVLNVLRFAISADSKERSEVRFTVAVRTGKTTTVEIDLKSLCGPGDDAEPVVTIMLPDED